MTSTSTSFPRFCLTGLCRGLLTGYTPSQNLSARPFSLNRCPKHHLVLIFRLSKAAALVAASSLLFIELACAGPAPVLTRQVETTPLDCTNLDTNGTIYKTAGSSLLVLCGFDFGGGDMGGSPQPTFADCMEACAATQDCIDVSYASGLLHEKHPHHRHPEPGRMGLDGQKGGRHDGSLTDRSRADLR